MSVRLVLLMVAVVTTAAAADTGITTTVKTTASVNITVCPMKPNNMEEGSSRGMVGMQGTDMCQCQGAMTTLYNTTCPATAGTDGLHWVADNCTISTSGTSSGSQAQTFVVKGYKDKNCQPATVTYGTCEAVSNHKATCHSPPEVLQPGAAAVPPAVPGVPGVASRRRMRANNDDEVAAAMEKEEEGEEEEREEEEAAAPATTINVTLVTGCNATNMTCTAKQNGCSDEVSFSDTATCRQVGHKYYKLKSDVSAGCPTSTSSSTSGSRGMNTMDNMVVPVITFTEFPTPDCKEDDGVDINVPTECGGRYQKVTCNTTEGTGSSSSGKEEFVDFQTCVDDQCSRNCTNGTRIPLRQYTNATSTDDNKTVYFYLGMCPPMGYKNITFQVYDGLMMHKEGCTDGTMATCVNITNNNNDMNAEEKEKEKQEHEQDKVPKGNEQGSNDQQSGKGEGGVKDKNDEKGPDGADGSTNNTNSTNSTPSTGGDKKNDTQPGDGHQSQGSQGNEGGMNNNNHTDSNNNKSSDADSNNNKGGEADSNKGGEADNNTTTTTTTSTSSADDTTQSAADSTSTEDTTSITTEDLLLLHDNNNSSDDGIIAPHYSVGVLGLVLCLLMCVY